MDQMISYKSSVAVVVKSLPDLQLTPWKRILPENLTGTQVVNKFPAFMEPEGLLPNLQKPVACPYPGPDRSLLCSPLLTSRRSSSILHSHLRLGIPSGSFSQVSPPKPCIHLSPYILHALLISFFLI